MSLSINVKYTDEKGNEQHVDLESHLMGFETCRHDFWGMPVMLEPGLKILPSLKTVGYLVIEGDQLSQLKDEAFIIQSSVDVIDKQVRFDRYFIMSRSQNVINAVETAKELKGRVTIG